MVRVSNPVSSKMVFAAMYSAIIAMPIVVGVSVFQLPDLWVISGLNDIFLPDSNWLALHALFYRFLFYAVLLFPFTLVYAFYCIPNRITFTDDGIRARFLNKELFYTYDSIRRIQFQDNDHGNVFLRLVLVKRKISIEVSPGQVRQINEYLPLGFLEK